jgi:hypothetical protein
MDVVADDAELDDPPGVSASNFGQQASQERGGARMDERQASERGPREERIKANGHRSIIGWVDHRRSILNRRDGSIIRALRGRARLGGRP